jgi:hypothetical protein
MRRAFAEFSTKPQSEGARYAPNGREEISNPCVVKLTMGIIWRRQALRSNKF